ncbi:hypothetical protein [Luteimonas fraxinea]|uniref:Uncharacterized protein n=1 Tax=Luteimonas fraxinea TaxID=2901869 RepID=A0ABS8UB21_9GAMM|nr:hypothetical protein [Luteimonas fraxinea]MCD9096696.1 hypothetical protein [Luteimonas fraxinea]MCD9126065.1 hypothetical protein [Luteimonas fraxinea]
MSIPDDAFVESALDRHDALSASARFHVRRVAEGVVIRLQDADSDVDACIPIDRALALLEKALERGNAVILQT